MPINSAGEEVDELEFECEECGSNNGEEPPEEWSHVAGFTCLDCGWLHM